MTAIDQYGFTSSPYPIILSIENHCSDDQQARVAQYMKNKFKDKLALPRQNMRQLPSPEELKYKVLVKGIRMSDSFIPVDSEGVSTKKKSHKCNSELSSVTFLGTTKITDFNENNANAPPDLMCSYEENVALDFQGDSRVARDWAAHNRSHLRYEDLLYCIILLLKMMCFVILECNYHLL